jgi:hypothetical protein
MPEKKRSGQKVEQKNTEKEVQEEDYRHDVIKTLTPLLLGSIAGAISYFVTHTPTEASRDPIGIIILVLFIYIHKFLLPKMGVDLKGGKDWLAISFLNFTAWYITWTIFLNM